MSILFVFSNIFQRLTYVVSTLSQHDVASWAQNTATCTVFAPRPSNLSLVVKLLLYVDTIITSVNTAQYLLSFLHEKTFFIVIVFHIFVPYLQLDHETLQWILYDVFNSQSRNQEVLRTKMRGKWMGICHRTAALGHYLTCIIH